MKNEEKIFSTVEFSGIRVKWFYIRFFYSSIYIEFGNPDVDLLIGKLNTNGKNEFIFWKLCCLIVKSILKSDENKEKEYLKYVYNKLNDREYAKKIDSVLNSLGFI